MKTLALHLQRLDEALGSLHGQLERIDGWGCRIADILSGGGRLLAVGNGGSAAHAQHLTGELVGRYLNERRPMSAIALHSDTSALTAIINDYGEDEAFARQVRAHGRRGDVLVAFSTSGRSPNVLAAVRAAHELDMVVLGLTGRFPNALAVAADDALVVEGDTPTIQEVHQVAIHLLCESIDARIAEIDQTLRVVGA